MNRGRALRVGAYAMFAAIWLGSGVFVFDSMRQLSRIVPGRPRTLHAASFDEFRSIDSALSWSERTSPNGFSGVYKNPLRKFDLPSSTKTPEPEKGVVDTCTLVIQAILDKGERSLAILRDKRGTSTICKKGDIVCDMTILRIDAASILLDGARGHQVLSLPEK